MDITSLMFFSHSFILRAIIAGTLMCLCCAPLGVTLVLKRYSMIGDGLSHVGFGAMSIALALNKAPVAVCIPVVIITAFFLLKLGTNSKIRGDSAIGLIAGVSLSLGVCASSLSGGLNSDVYGYMFGSVLAMTKTDVIICAVLCSIILIFFVVCYHQIFAVTFDEDFSKATGTNSDLYIAIIAILTALCIVIGLRMMGAMLISNLIIFPALTSMRIFRQFKAVIVSSGIVAVFCFLLGMFFSYIFGIPAGASVVLTNAVVFVIFFIIGKALKIS